MFDSVVIIGLGCLVLTLAKIDRVFLGTWCTPFTCLALPYVSVVILAFFVSAPLEFVSLYTPSVIVWIIGLAIFWVVGFTVYFGFYGRGPGERQSTHIDDLAPAFRKYLLICGCACAVVMFYGFLVAIRSVGTIGALGSMDFRVAYMYGWTAHVRLICVPILICLIGTLKIRDRVQLLIVIVLCGLFLLSQVKGLILQPIVAGLIFRILTGRARLRFPTLIIVGIVGYVVFNLAYLIGMAASDSDLLLTQATGYLFRHFFMYLLNGVLSFGESMRLNVAGLGGEDDMVFAPFINLFRTLLGTGDVIAAGSPKSLGMMVDTTTADPSQLGNVYTLFGTLYWYLGSLGSILYTGILGGLCYTLAANVRYSKHTVFSIAGYAFVCSQLVFGFFECYFMYLTAIEVVAYCIALDWIVRSFTLDHSRP